MTKQKEASFLHRGIIKNGKFIADRPDWYYGEMKMKEGRRVEITIEDEREEKTISQLGFYFGVIVKKICANHFDFQGWDWREIHTEILLEAGRFHYKTREPGEPLIIFDDIKFYTKDEMTTFLEDAMRTLVENHEIYIPDPHNFKLNKYQDGAI